MVPAVAAAKEVKDASTNLIVRFLGPSVDVWANHFKQWNQGLFEQRAENVNRVLEAADRKRGTPIENAGGIHPRVLKEILDDGSFVEDELMADYFGGVLASSATGVSRDDRGASMAKLVTELSTFEIRLHFVMYRAFKEVFDGSTRNVGVKSDCEKMELFFPLHSLAAAMDLSETEFADVIVGYCLNGFLRHSIIGDFFAFGNPDALKVQWSGASKSGLIVHPSAFGVSLFMWAHGVGALSETLFIDQSVTFDYSGVDIPEVPGVVATHKITLPLQAEITNEEERFPS
jgi:hypothetical protein